MPRIKAWLPAIEDLLAAAGYVFLDQHALQASVVGLPLRRKRWFAICVPSDGAFQVDRLAPLVDGFTWLPLGAEPHPKWVVKPPRGSPFYDHFRMLGNAIVPAQARYAFHLMASRALGRVEEPPRPWTGTEPVNTIAELGVARPLWPSPLTQYSGGGPTSVRSSRFFNAAVCIDDTVRAEIEGAVPNPKGLNLTSIASPSTAWEAWLMGYPTNYFDE